MVDQKDPNYPAVAETEDFSRFPRLMDAAMAKKSAKLRQPLFATLLLALWHPALKQYSHYQ
jgi:hypothetical protein